MNRILAALITLTMAVGLGGTAAPVEAVAGPVAITTSGPVRGVHDSAVDRFRGIPYAAPPVGDARWKTPRAPRSWWPSTRAAGTSGSPCPQLSGGKPLPGADEDCLYLDVTTPRRQAGAARTIKPVMVWLHGGGNTMGSGSEFDPARMATIGDVVVVTMNYRLGTLGLFSYDGLPGSGSFGLLDQQAALRWVRQNAIFFGGDPSNVTLFGESAGGIDTCAQLTSPAARGLFDKAILQSGSCAMRVPTAPVGENVAISQDDMWTPVEELREQGREVAAELGCDTLACLRELPVEKLLPYEYTFGLASGTPTLPESPEIALAKGRFHRVPVLSGNTRDEARYTTMLIEFLTGPITGQRYDALLRQAFGADAGRVRAVYSPEEYGSPSLAFAAMDTDRAFACPQLRTGRALARQVPAYGYEFADRTAPTYAPFFTDLPPGAAHGSELAYLFDLAIGPWGPDFQEVELTSRQRALGDEMIRAWTRFARTGSPAADPNAWPELGTGDAPLVWSFAVRPASGLRADTWTAHHCDLWSEIT